MSRFLITQQSMLSAHRDHVPSFGAVSLKNKLTLLMESVAHSICQKVDLNKKKKVRKKKEGEVKRQHVAKKKLVYNLQDLGKLA